MMVTKLPHPYKDHPEPFKWDESKLDDIDEIYDW
jgi:hypothetical protein